MVLRAAYRRYRVWATRFDARWAIATGTAMGLLAVRLLGFSSPAERTWIYHQALPWLLVIGGPIAALDAWGAADHRGEPEIGAIRAAVILVLCLGLAAYVRFA